MATREDFLLEQYKHLASTIARQQNLRWEWQKFGIIGTFGFYAIIFSKDFSGINSTLPQSALWLPVLLNVLGLFVSYAIRQSIVEMAGHIQVIEAEFSFEGWEHNRAENRKRIGFRSIPMTASTYLFWFIMSVVTFFAATHLKIGK